MTRCLLTEHDPTLGKIVRRHLDVHAVTDDGADAKLAHLSRCIGDDLVLIVEEDGEAAIGEDLLDKPFHGQQFFLGQT